MKDNISTDDLLKYSDAKFRYCVIKVTEDQEDEFWTLELDEADAKNRVINETAAYEDPEYQFEYKKIVRSRAPQTKRERELGCEGRLSVHLTEPSVADQFDILNDKRPFANVIDIFPTVKAMREGEWNWLNNSRCKHLRVNIDMRDGTCFLIDRDDNFITKEILELQHRGSHS